ncbi:MAG TPA: radical SAM family heme chaperone HemW [Nitrosospira sp.]|nr:radical SAM family heme chaperone HemW [Nitrosospira sp.]
MSSTVSLASLSASQAPRLKSLPPLSLYVHIPWCVRKCPYCDFNSHEVRGRVPDLPEEEYVAALVSDLEQSIPTVWGRNVVSVFFGGGTPSLFSAQSIDAILSAARALLTVELLAEVTLEANPGTFEAQKFADFRSAGINRLSVGIQSFNSRHLQALGRIHDGDDARRAIEIAQKNFDNVNLDLMYGLPDQSLDEARSDIETGVSSGVSHISAYHLTVEPNTLFHRYPPTLPDDDLAAEMQIMIEQTLRENGYVNYETSAFAQSGRESRHNMNYWLFGDYLGVGAGAHSKISFRERIIRQVRYKQPKEYLSRAASGMSDSAALIMEQHEVTRSDRIFEFMMNALRLTTGFAAETFVERTGVPITAIQRQLDEAERGGLIERDYRRIAPTLTGKRFLNDLLQIFLPQKSRT